MAQIQTADDATLRASWNHSVRLGTTEPITNDAGDTVGWTFATQQGGRTQYGWVAADGRVSPALEPYRSGAEEYARLNLT